LLEQAVNTDGRAGALSVGHLVTRNPRGHREGAGDGWGMHLPEEPPDRQGLGLQRLQAGVQLNDRGHGAGGGMRPGGGKREETRGRGGSFRRD